MGHEESHLKALESDLKGLIDFKVQTTLESFNEKPEEMRAAKKIIPELDEEPLQCLIGL
ncbi:hypothetical protein [Methanobacterium aggregans]|uniref:hypothetical protein n=1 Tax=Methanobacterium aggregans TaxID=1615586 RepID=UPI00320C96AC